MEHLDEILLELLYFCRPHSHNNTILKMAANELGFNVGFVWLNMTLDSLEKKGMIQINDLDRYMRVVKISAKGELKLKQRK